MQCACATDFCEHSFRHRLRVPIASGLLLGAAFVFQYAARVELLADTFFLLAIVVGAAPLVPRAWRGLRAGRTNMYFLMTIAVAGALAIHELQEAAVVVFLFSLAEALEDYATYRSRRALREILDQPARELLVRRNGKEMVVPESEVRRGDIVIVRTGERIPVDGEVLQGEGLVDQAPITGESLPEEKGPGDPVYGGTLLTSGLLEVRVERVPQEATIARIRRLVERAQQERTQVERWMDRFAQRYVPAMLVFAVLTATIPPLLGWGSWTDWIYRALVLLVISCPCALVLSSPVAMASSLTIAARNGVLFKGASFMELLPRLRVFAFDKTGTLTLGEPRVVKVVPTEGHTPDRLLRVASALARKSTHPLARAIRQHAEQLAVAPLEAQEVETLRGLGLRGKVRERTYYMGSSRFLGRVGVEPRMENLPRSKALVFLGRDDHVCGAFVLEDAVRGTAEAVIRHLKRHCGIREVILITGDRREVADAVARRLGVDTVYAELLPEDKERIVAELDRTKGPLAMVGDGINDAPALARARLGIAVASVGNDLALESAHVALMTGDLSRLPYLLHLARYTMRIVYFNIAFSLAVKFLFFALALFGAASLWAAVLADTGATLLVVANGLRILRVRLETAL